jgi:hypothetical protein
MGFATVCSKFNGELDGSKEATKAKLKTQIQRHASFVKRGQRKNNVKSWRPATRYRTSAKKNAMNLDLQVLTCTCRWISEFSFCQINNIIML